MSKLHGSVVFGTHRIRTDEYVLMAKTMTENGSSIEETALTIEALDDMLSAMSMRSIIQNQRFTAKGRIRKDSTLGNMIDRRLDVLNEDLKALQNAEKDSD